MTMQKQADICLVLEGTYPYVTGGVSSWTHQLINSLSEFSFALAVILPSRKDKGEPRYPLPPNIVEMRELFLHDYEMPAEKPGSYSSREFQAIADYHHSAEIKDKTRHMAEIYQRFFSSPRACRKSRAMLNTRNAWDLLTELYRDHAGEDSFLDYFWSTRFIHMPLFQVMSVELPRARVYHTLSTGYAGFWASLGAMRHHSPLLLTEHGIYTRERRIEISRADWIYQNREFDAHVRESQSRFKDMWNTMFSMLSQITYETAARIITLYSGNQEYQIADGADPEKMQIIPNGVDVEHYKPLYRQRMQEGKGRPFTIGFMGRVVSIKDVKTFIRMCRIVADAVPELRVLLMGPTDEEPEYYQECLTLTRTLGLDRIIQFTGKVAVREYYPKIDVLVLTSISEAQPLVVMEANCLGIPCVTTDVGACREQLYGRTQSDKLLGQSGIVAGVTQAGELAEAVITLSRSATLRRRMGLAGMRRVEKYYNKRNLDERYRRLYAYYLENQQAPPSLQGRHIEGVVPDGPPLL